MSEFPNLGGLSVRDGDEVPAGWEALNDERPPTEVEGLSSSFWAEKFCALDYLAFDVECPLLHIGVSLRQVRLLRGVVEFPCE